MRICKKKEAIRQKEKASRMAKVTASGGKAKDFMGLAIGVVNGGIKRPTANGGSKHMASIGMQQMPTKKVMQMKQKTASRPSCLESVSRSKRKRSI